MTPKSVKRDLDLGWHYNNLQSITDIIFLFVGDGIGVNFENINIPKAASYCSSYIRAESELVATDKTKIMRF